MIRKVPRLALALDSRDREECHRLAKLFEGLPVVLKIGLRVLPLLSRDDIVRIKGLGVGLFIDAKLHDIPSQVGGAVETWGELGADYITVHLSGGPAMLREAVKAAQGRSEILGVSVLTSLGSSDLASLGFQPDPLAQVERLARVGLAAGVRSFVCSVAESMAIHHLATHEYDRSDVITVCPGIRFAGEAAASDQSRSYTVEEAREAGVNMLVVGRAVFSHVNPRARVEEILRTLG